MKKIIQIGILFFLGLVTGWSQTTNEGQLTVSEGTIFSTVGEFINRDGAQFYNDGSSYIYSHFDNEGIVDYTQDTGFTLFVGNNVQAISGSQVSYLYDVLFENNSQDVPFQLAGLLNINGEANFLQGIVDNENYGGEFGFGPEGYHINVADESHVNGPVIKQGNQDFQFPVGKSGYYRMAKITAPENPNAIFEGEFFHQNSDDIYSHSLVPGAIVKVDNQQYWVIQNQTSTSEDDVYVTLSLRNETTPDFIMNAGPNNGLTILRWDEDMNMWVDEGGTYEPNSQTVTTHVSGFGYFVLATLDEDLVSPCHIIVYNAVTPNGDGINDYLRIDNQGECARRLNVKVYNRWGRMVYRSNNYGIDGDVFDGYSSGLLTLRKDRSQLPTGTYFYILEYEYESEDDDLIKTHKQAGYLYLSGN